MTIVLIPYIPGRLVDRTADWALANRAQLVDVSGSDDAYWSMLATAWCGSDDLVVVEHDIVPPLGTVYGFDQCPEEWCTCGYLISDTLLVEHSLGCVRFSALLQNEIPDAIERAGEQTSTVDPPRSWWSLDYRLDHVLRLAGHRPHVHGRAEHLHSIP